ncbi:hypothetical protein Tco_1123997 [Tanacetum coccineum]|uniref:Uncharacterized protein n=1 Tax=Tanacetum coccineum TaxID=301880 RepID=A0ABQ5J4X3_9ASTR
MVGGGRGGGVVYVVVVSGGGGFFVVISGGFTYGGGEGVSGVESASPGEGARGVVFGVMGGGVWGGDVWGYPSSHLSSLRSALKDILAVLFEPDILQEV